MTKEEVISALKYDNAMITFDPMTGEDVDLESLNEANRMHYEANLYCINMLKPKPYILEELKPNMWVWDDKHEDCKQICRVNKEKRAIWYHGIYVEYEAVEFEENRFYPVEKANQRGE